jgi:hypothetical protein
LYSPLKNLDVYASKNSRIEKNEKILSCSIEIQSSKHYKMTFGKTLFIVLYFPFFSFGQLEMDSSDLLDRKSPLEFHYIFNPEWKMHNHIFDFQTIGLFQSNAGALGYTYLFKTSEKFRFGLRIGAWYRQTRDADLATLARKRYIYSGSLVLNFKVWKVISFHYEGGVSQAYSEPLNSNTTSIKARFEEPSIDQRIMLNTIWFQHFVFNVGYQFRYYYNAEFWGGNPCLVIGFKF